MTRRGTSQRGALDILDQPPAVAGVGEDTDREIALGNELEQQDVTAQRAAMRGGANGSDRFANARRCRCHRPVLCL
jgi:hypothetical protein